MTGDRISKLQALAIIRRSFGVRELAGTPARDAQLSPEQLEVVLDAVMRGVNVWRLPQEYWPTRANFLARVRSTRALFKHVLIPKMGGMR